MTKQRFGALIVLAAALLAGGPAASFAQPELPAEIVGAQTIGPEQLREIREFIDRHVPGLSNADPAEVKRSRTALLSPLEARPGWAGPSVAFRLEYARLLAPRLAAIAREGTDLAAINALIITGALATDDSVRVLDAFREDQRAPVRYAAVAGYARTFKAVAEASPALPPATARRVVDALGVRVAREEHPEVLDAAVRSLAAAVAIVDRAEFRAVRPQATTVLAREMSERLARLEGGPEDAAVLPVALRAGQAVRDALTAQAARPGEEAARHGGLLGGQMIAYVVRRLARADFPQINGGDGTTEARQKQELRIVPATVVTMGESLIRFSASALNRPVQESGLADQFVKASREGDQAFARGYLPVIGVLTQPPFGFPQEKFPLR